MLWRISAGVDGSWPFLHNRDYGLGVRVIDRHTPKLSSPHMICSAGLWGACVKYVLEYARSSDLAKSCDGHPKRDTALGEKQSALRTSIFPFEVEELGLQRWWSRTARFLVRRVGMGQLARAGNSTMCYLGLS